MQGSPLLSNPLNNPAIEPRLEEDLLFQQALGRVPCLRRFPTALIMMLARKRRLLPLMPQRALSAAPAQALMVLASLSAIKRATYRPGRGSNRPEFGKLCCNARKTARRCISVRGRVEGKV